MAQPRRRVSYVIPPPTNGVPLLKFPDLPVSKLGVFGPLLISADSSSPAKQREIAEKEVTSPRHRLGISSLALDCATQLDGHTKPEGILYSGGRDGLLISWDLGIPMKPREQPVEDGIRRRWEIMTGWNADELEEDQDDADERPGTDGDVLGDVTVRRKSYRIRALPYEMQWESDLDALNPEQPSRFRQCATMHADWINDIVLCNHNQTVVSASSDGTVKAWNPHSQPASDPSVIGSHKDYVRCLAYCREQNWIASGSFDRTIKLWDLSRSAASASAADPVMTLNPADAGAPKSSVYAIATDPYGSTIASGSPERVVRMWDPRSGKRTGKLVGHTDNIRAILISDDAKYLLTGSADASIKLWSLSSQRCIHTFTHHTDSVWSLFSNHPSLEIFYSGDRSGLVCKVDVEDCSDVSEGECILLCQDSERNDSWSSEGINKLVAMDDNLLWTATASSTIKRWRVPQRRAVRANALAIDNDVTLPSEGSIYTQTHRHSSSVTPSIYSLHSDKDTWTPQRDREDTTTLYGIPFESLVKFVSPNDPFTPYSPAGKSKDPEVATLYSAASVMSVPRTTVRSPNLTNYHSSSQDGHRSILQSSARAEYELRDIAADAVPLYTTPDSTIPGDSGLVRCIILNDRMHALTVDTSGQVAVWDIVRGVCKGRFAREDVSSAVVGSTSHSRNGSAASQEDQCSPREALETVRELIEGEAAVSAWAKADTKSGVLTIHLDERCFEAEVYADEVGFRGDKHFNDESKLNPGKWILRNLFIGFIREEQRNRRRTSQDTRPSLELSPRKSPKRSTSSGVISNPDMTPALPPPVAPSPPASPLVPTMIPLYPLSRDNSLPLINTALTATPGLLSSNDATPMPTIRVRTGTLDSAAIPPSAKEADYFTLRRNPAPATTPDDFSSFGSPGGTNIIGGSKPEMTPVTPSTPGGGLIGKIRNFTKGKKPGSEVSTPIVGSVVVPEPVVASPAEVPPLIVTKTPVQILLSNPLTPPSSSEAPMHHLPSGMSVLISEEGASGYTIVYRGTVSLLAQDTTLLEEEMPFWLIEYLLTNKVPPMPSQVKVSFVLLPWPTKDGEQLPELLNTQQSKLTAGRSLRVRKLVLHVHEKMEKLLQPEITSHPRSSLDGQEQPASPKPRAEDMYEILCNDVLLPLDMTLAAVRQYVWRQSTELVMHYRRKV